MVRGGPPDTTFFVPRTPDLTLGRRVICPSGERAWLKDMMRTVAAPGLA